MLHSIIRSVLSVCVVVAAVAILFSAPVFAQQAAIYCSSASADADGDGWGWERNRTCIVAGSKADPAGQYPRCTSQGTDPDGDGYGWENNKTCAAVLSFSGGQNQDSKKPKSDLPACLSAQSDPDGDGYGWENNRSCLAGTGSSDTADKGASDHPDCSSSSTDPDGDGFGFENGVTCLVVADGQARNLPACQSANSDPDGDGFGWENNQSCLAEISQRVCSSESADPDGDGFGWENGATCVVEKKAKPGSAESAQIADITDVIVVTGQSNVAASETTFNAGLDQPDQRVFAYTDSGWQIADLHQVWDENAAPGNHSLNNSGREPQNSFAFHFGKNVAEKTSNRVPAFIVAAAPGKGIAHWDYNSDFYNKLGGKIRDALKAIPHKSSIDVVLWHQGESDWLYEGTADAGATGFSSENSDEYRNYYAIKLASLIKNFRNESWGRSDTAFICGETRRAEGVNRRLMALNNDSDPQTGCVAATDLPKRSDDPYGSHFSSEGLRTLGQRYADVYLQMIGQ